MLSAALLHAFLVWEQSLKEMPLPGTCQSQGRGEGGLAESAMALRASAQRCHMSLPHTYHWPKQVTVPSDTPMEQKL